MTVAISFYRQLLSQLAFYGCLYMLEVYAGDHIFDLYVFFGLTVGPLADGWVY